MERPYRVVCESHKPRRRTYSTLDRAIQAALATPVSYETEAVLVYYCNTMVGKVVRGQLHKL